MMLNTDDEGIGAFSVFDGDRPQATDRGESGMVAEMDAFIRLTHGMKAFLDVGALFGIFSLVFTRHPNTTAYAIEASSWAFPFLESYCEANPERNIIPLQRFAGEATGRIVQCGRDWKHVVANRPTNETTSMTETRIDDMDEIEACDVIKIDVEGYECQVLRGAVKLIERFRPLLFVECHMNDLPINSESRESLMQIFNDIDYCVQRYDGSVVNDFLDGSMTRVTASPK